MNTINITMTNTTFRNANEAYEYLHDKIIQEGIKFGDTKALFNVRFYIFLYSRIIKIFRTKL